jgi:hypothetical protein
VELELGSGTTRKFGRLPGSIRQVRAGAGAGADCCVSLALALRRSSFADLALSEATAFHPKPFQAPPSLLTTHQSGRLWVHRLWLPTKTRQAVRGDEASPSGLIGVNG